MKRLFFHPYSLLRWLIITLISLSLLLLFLLESPSIVLSFAKSQLQEQGISYESVDGGFLSGIGIKGLNYQNQIKVKKIDLKIDFEKLIDRVLYIDTMNLEDIEIDKKYLSSLIDNNSTDDNSSDMNLPFDRVVFKEANISLKGILYSNYVINSVKLKIKNLRTDMKEKYEGNIEVILNSNITKLNLDASIKNNFLKLVADTEIKREFINPLISDNNLSFKNNPILTIKADGNLEKIKYHIDVHRLGLKQNEYSIDTKRLTLFGNYNIPKKDITATINTELKGNMAYLKLNGETKLNLDDLDNSLKFNLLAKLRPKKEFVLSTIPDEKLDIQEVADIDIKASGNLDNIEFDVGLKELKLKREDIELELETLSLIGKTDPLKGDTIVNLLLDFNSTGGRGRIEDRVTLNFNKLESSLEYNGTVDIDSYPKYLNRFLTKQKITVEGSPKTKIKLNGTARDIEIRLDANADFRHNNITSRLIVKSTPVTLDFNSSMINGGMELKNYSKEALFNMQTSFSGDVSRPKTLNINSVIGIDKFNSFGVNLETVLPLKLQIKKSSFGAELNLNSKKLNLLAKSSDYDTVSFNLDSEKIYMYKIIELPKELEHKYLKLDLDGEATLSKEHFSLKGTVGSNKKFQAKVDINNSNLGLNGKVEMDHLLAKVAGNIKNKNLKLKVKVDSLKKLKREIDKLYKIEELIIDGILNCDIDYKQKGLKKTILGSVDIEKLELSYEAKFLESDYDPDVIIISKKDKRKKDKKDNSFLKHTAINLKISAKEAKYRTRDIGLKFDVDLNANKKFGKKLKLLGKIKEIMGHVDQTPKRYDIKESNIIFIGEGKINPLLDIFVEYKLPQVLIKIGIGGTASRPKLNFSSEPLLPKKDILSYLLLGVSTANLGKGGGTLTKEAELFILNQAARDLAYDIDLDRLFIKDDGTGEGYAVESGKKVSKKNMIIIESSKEGNSFILEHDVSKNIKLRVGQHQKELPSQSLDLYFRKKFK